MWDAESINLEQFFCLRTACEREPAWPSGKVLSRLAEGPRLDPPLRLTFNFPVNKRKWFMHGHCLDRDFALHKYWNNTMAHMIAAHLNADINLVVTV